MNNYIYIENEGLKYWPMCPIKGCSNRICLRLNSDKCWPHTASSKTPEELLELMNKELPCPH